MRGLGRGGRLRLERRHRHVWRGSSSRSRSIREGYRSDPACKMGFLDGSPGSFERAIRVGAVRWLGA